MLIYDIELAKRHKVVEFPIREHVTTIVPDDKIPKEFPLAFENINENTAFMVGCGCLGIIVAGLLWLLFVN